MHPSYERHTSQKGEEENVPKMKLARNRPKNVACHKREFIAIMGGTCSGSLISIPLAEIENTAL